MRADRGRRRARHQTPESRRVPNLEHSSKSQHEQPSHSLRRSFEFFTRDGAEADAVSSTKKYRRIFLRIEQLQRRPANHVPATGRFDRINSGLPSTDPDRAGRNLFAWNIAPRRREPARQTAEKGKTGRESDAMNAVIGSAMKIDNFFPVHARMLRDVFEIERKFLFVTNGDLYKRAFDPICLNLRQRFANSLLKPSKNIFDRRARVDRADRITKKRYGRVGRRELNHAGNLRGFKRAFRREHFI